MEDCLCAAVQLGHLRLHAYLPDGFDGSGGRLWCGGLILAGWIAEQAPCSLSGRSVVELGCGSTALPSAVAALRGAATCVASDASSDALEMARHNMVLNSAPVTVQQLDWARTVDDAVFECLGRSRVDLILFADIIYTTGSADKLAEFIDAVLAREGEVIGVLCAFHDGFAEFLQAMHRKDFVARHLLGCPELLCSIDNGDVISSGDSMRGKVDLIEDLPTSSRRLVSWQRHSNTDVGQHDEHASILAYMQNVDIECRRAGPVEDISVRFPRVTAGVF